MLKIIIVFAILWMKIGVNAMYLYESIFSRKSVRGYKIAPLEQSRLDEILRFAKGLPMLFPEIQVEFTILDNTKNKRNGKNRYFDGVQLLKAPYYLILTSTKENGYFMNAGYLMQQISLYLTTKNLGSCFIGSLKLATEVELSKGMDYVIALAFGESKSNINRPAVKAKRLPEEDVVVYKEEVNESLKTMLKAARLAPSSMNNQPWRFVVYKNRIHVFCKKNLFTSRHISKMKLIDIGISLANLLVVAEEMWIDVSVLRLDNISNKSFKSNDYIITVKLI